MYALQVLFNLKSILLLEVPTAFAMAAAELSHLGVDPCKVFFGGLRYELTTTYIAAGCIYGYIYIGYIYIYI